MATLYVSFAQMISEAGLSAALIQQRGLTEDQVARLGGVALVLGVGFAAISLALSTPIAWFFGEPSVRWIIMALSATFLTRGLQVLPRSLLARDLEFRKLAWIDGFEAVTVALMTLVLAVLGLRVWALVLGTLLGNLATSLLCLRWRPHARCRDAAPAAGAVRGVPVHCDPHPANPGIHGAREAQHAVQRARGSRTPGGVLPWEPLGNHGRGAGLDHCVSPALLRLLRAVRAPDRRDVVACVRERLVARGQHHGGHDARGARTPGSSSGHVVAGAAARSPRRHRGHGVWCGPLRGVRRPCAGGLRSAARPAWPAHWQPVGGRGIVAPGGRGSTAPGVFRPPHPS